MAFRQYRSWISDGGSCVVIGEERALRLRIWVQEFGSVGSDAFEDIGGRGERGSAAPAVRRGLARRPEHGP